MSEPLARLYDLALRTLDDQERRADALRGRLGPTLAAAALGVTLLSGPLVGGSHPVTLVGKLMLLVAVGAFFVAVANALTVLVSRRLETIEIHVHLLADELQQSAALKDAEAFYSTMITRCGRRASANAAMLDRLHTRFTTMLCGILVMLCGLAVAAFVG